MEAVRPFRSLAVEAAGQVTEGDPIAPPDVDSPTDFFPLLRDLQNRPDLMRPPEEVVPRLAFRGRTTLLNAGDKSGKSTLAGHAAAAKSRGDRWLGRTLSRGHVVVVAPDEAPGETVRRMQELDADPDRVRILLTPPTDMHAMLSALLEESPADLVIVDSLAEYSRLQLGRAPEDGDSSGWGAVIRPLVALSRSRDVALLILHHVRRSDGQYRGSGEIAAAVDCLLEMIPPEQGEDPTLRRFRGRARWPIEEFSVRLTDQGYVLGGGGSLSLEAQVLADTNLNPGTSRTAQFKRIGGRKQTYLATVTRLVEGEQVVDRNGHLFLPGHVEGDLL